MPAALRLLGPLEVRLVERSFREVVRRHGTLRTRFAENGGAPVQVIDPPGAWSLPRIDLEALPGPRRKEESARLAAADAAQAFDLARGPLLRAALVRLAEGEHVLLLCCHHAVVDGWSVSLLINELLTIYTAFVASRPSPLPELPLQYADLAVQQRARLAGPVLAARLAHWRRQLDGAPRLLALPSDRPRPERASLRADQIDLPLSPYLGGRLAAFAMAEKSSFYMMLLTALALVLGGWSGEDEVVIGSPSAGRERRETEKLIGLFLNALPMRIDLSGRPTFRELLRRARRTSLDAFAHQEVSFEGLLDALDVPREPSHAPLFQVLLNVLNLPPIKSKLPSGLRVEQLPEGTVQTRFDLVLETHQQAGSNLRISLIYATDLFDRWRMERLLSDLLKTLNRAVDTPDAVLAVAPPTFSVDFFP